MAVVRGRHGAAGGAGGGRAVDYLGREGDVGRVWGFAAFGGEGGFAAARGGVGGGDDVDLGDAHLVGWLGMREGGWMDGVAVSGVKWKGREWIGAVSEQMR